MSKNHNDLEDFVNGLVQPTKIAESDLDRLSLTELEALVGLDFTTDDEKVAYLTEAVKSAYGDDRYGSWLEQFEGSPLKAKAVQLCEQELALEQQSLQRRIERDAQMKEEDTWTQRDMLRLQKDMLMLELHKSKSGMGAGAGGADPTMQPQAAPAEPAAEEPTEEVAVVAPEEPAPAAPPKPKADKKPVKTPAKEEGKTAGLLAAIEKRSNDVQTVGQINNGDPNSPTWPRAALGVDSAGRRATAEEAAQQSSHGMPDIAHVQPETGTKSAGAATQLGEAVMKHVDRMPGVAQRALGHATRAGQALGGKTTEQALGRGLVAAGGAAAGTAAAAGLASRKKESSETAEAVRGLPFGGEQTDDRVPERRSNYRLDFDDSVLHDEKGDGSKLTRVGAVSANFKKRYPLGGALLGGTAAALISAAVNRGHPLALEAGLANAFHGSILGAGLGGLVGAKLRDKDREDQFVDIANRHYDSLHKKASGAATAVRSLTKAKPTQALHALALPKHLAKTNPAQAIQAGRQFGAPVVANANVLDQLSRTSFDKLSVSKDWLAKRLGTLGPRTARRVAEAA